MNRYRFFKKILAQLDEIQTSLNALRGAIKEEVRNDAQMLDPEE